MALVITIVSVRVITGRGMDRITLVTRYPAPGEPDDPNAPRLELDFNAPRGQGIEFVRTQLGINPDVQTLATPAYKFGE